MFRIASSVLNGRVGRVGLHRSGRQLLVRWACSPRLDQPATQSMLLREVCRAPAHFSSETRGAKKWSRAPSGPTAPRDSPSYAAVTHRLVGLESFSPQPIWDVTNHGRISSGDGLLALRFPLEYTMFSVRGCYFSFHAEEEQGRQSAPSWRGEIIQVVTARDVLLFSRHGPSSWRLEVRRGAPRLYDFHIQDLFRCGETGTKRQLLPLL